MIGYERRMQPTYPRGGDINYVKIRTASGTIVMYGHVTPMPAITNGARVNADDIIGHVDISGRSSGPHVHFSTSTAPDTNSRYNPGCYLPGPGGQSP